MNFKNLSVINILTIVFIGIILISLYRYKNIKEKFFSNNYDEDSSILESYKREKCEDGENDWYCKKLIDFHGPCDKIKEPYGKIIRAQCPVSCGKPECNGNPYVPSTPQLITPAPCEDKRDYCAGKKHECFRGVNKNWMHENCKKTCGLCENPDKNFDSCDVKEFPKDQCCTHDYIRLANDNYYYCWNDDNQKNRCCKGFTPPPPPPPPPTHCLDINPMCKEWAGEKGVNCEQTFMKENCIPTCKGFGFDFPCPATTATTPATTATTPAPTPPPCEDKFPNECNRKELGELACFRGFNKDWMHKNCMKTCGLCENPDKNRFNSCEHEKFPKEECCKKPGVYIDGIYRYCWDDINNKQRNECCKDFTETPTPGAIPGATPGAGAGATPGATPGAGAGAGAGATSTAATSAQQPPPPPPSYSCPRSKDELCWGSDYPCEQCCSTGINPIGQTCWDTDYTKERCCKP